MPQSRPQHTQEVQASKAHAATISKAQGAVLVERDGSEIALQQGDTLYSSDTIKTTQTPVELAFADGSSAELGPETVMKIADFVFENDKAPNFVMELALGTMRSISGAVVEQNPDAFKVIMPRATVGIRGTNFVLKVNLDGSAEVALVSIDQGHNLVITTHDGHQLSLGSAFQGAFVGAEGETPLQMHTFTEEELQNLVNLLSAVFAPEGDDATANEEEVKESVEEEHYVTDTTLLLLDEAQLGTANAQALADALEEAGVNVGILSAPPTPLAEGGSTDVDDDLYPEATGGDDGSHASHVSIDGSTDYFADGQAAVGTLAAQSIIITADVSKVVTLSGDTDIVSAGTVTAGHDKIAGQGMSNGTLVGDALTMTGGTLIAGNDDISLQQKTGGQSIYGDVKEVTGGTVTFGDDTIIINGNFSNSIIAGDTGHVSGAQVNAWGADTITIKGDMGIAGDASGDINGAGTSIVGDTVESFEGGNDTISVEGTMYGGSFIDAGGGDDSITIGTMSGGAHIYAGSGADTITVGSMHGNGASEGSFIDLGFGFDPTTSEITHDGHADILYLSGTGSLTLYNFNTDSDQLYVNGTLYTVRGNDTYDGYELTFENLSGNMPPVVPETGSGSVVEEGAQLTPPSDVYTEGSYTAAVGATDPNPDDMLTYSVGTGANAPQYGTVTFDGDNYTYTLDNSNTTVNGRAEGATLIEHFTIIVTDSKGATTEQSVTVTITGKNDAPTLTVENLTIDEDAQSPYQVHGTAVGSDPDTGAQLTYSLENGESEVDGGLVFGVGEHGTLTLDSTNGSYTYTLESGREGLASNTTEYFTIIVTDEHGESVQKEISVTITAEDDAPVVEHALTSADNGVTEDSSEDKTVQGTLNIKDTDTAGMTFTITESFGDGQELSAAGTLSSDYGTFTLIEHSDGTYSYTFTLSEDENSGVQALKEGDQQPLTYIVKATAGGKETTEEITIVITGTNELPEWNVAPEEQSIAVSENESTGSGESSVAFSVTDADADSSGPLSYMVMHGNLTGDPAEGLSMSAAGEYGTLTILEATAAPGSYTYEYELDPNKAQYMPAHYSGNETFTIIVKDAHGAYVKQEVTVALTGDANSSMRFTAADLKTLTEGDVISEHDDAGKAFGDTVIDFTQGMPSDLADAMPSDVKFRGDGDAADGFTGGNDAITVTGDYNSSAHIFGDTDTMSNTSFDTGDDTITVTGHAYRAYIFGDVDTVTGEEGGAITTTVDGNDSISVNGTANGAFIYGDADTATNATITGNDSIRIGTLASTADVYGDVDTANGSTTVSGDDSIIIGSMDAGEVFGDAQQVLGNGRISGSDHISVGATMDAGAIYGDAQLVYSGTHEFTSSDFITVGGSVSYGANIYGDIGAINPNSTSEWTYNVTVTGHDVIDVGGNVSGNIYGDFGDVNSGSVTATGHDLITVRGNVDYYGVIYGDANEAKRGFGESVSITGHDIITVHGALNGTVYGDVANAGTVGVTVAGDDIITVNGEFSGDIYMGTGKNVVHVHDKVNSGDFITGANAHDVIFLNSAEAQTVNVDLKGARGGQLVMDLSDFDSSSQIYITTGGDAEGLKLYFVGVNTSSKPQIWVDAVDRTTQILGTPSESWTDKNITFYNEATYQYDSVSAGDYEADATNSVVYINGNMDVGAAIYGDVNLLSADGADDVIILNGHMSAGAIYGDAHTASAGNTGSDVITLKNGMSDGTVYGDAHTVSNTAEASGADIITVYGDMRGGAIYGDTDTFGGTGAISGNDTIIIEGNMSGDATIYADYTSSLTAGRGGDDRVIVRGVMSDGTIDLGVDNDTLMVGAPDKGMTGGTIKAEATAFGAVDEDTIIIHVGEAVKDAIKIEVDDTDTLVLHDEAAGEAHVTISGLSEGTTFWVDDTAVEAGTSGTNATYGSDLIIHFTS